MADTIPGGQCRPVILYGRNPSGVLTAITTDGSGNLNVTGSISAVDTVANSVPNPVMVYGRSPAGVLTAVTTDGTGKLS